MATMLNAESNFTRPNQIQACTNSVLSSKQSRQYTKDCTNKNNVVNRKKNLYKLLKQVPHTHTFLTKTIHEKKRNNNNAKETLGTATLSWACIF